MQTEFAPDYLLKRRQNRTGTAVLGVQRWITGSCKSIGELCAMPRAEYGWVAIFSFKDRTTSPTAFSALGPVLFGSDEQANVDKK